MPLPPVITRFLASIRASLRPPWQDENRAEPQAPGEHYSFIHRAAMVAASLSERLGVQLVSERGFADGPLGRAFERLNTLERAGSTEERDRRLALLRLLAVQLGIIKKHDPALLESFKRVLLNGNHDELLGTRFEITVAVALVLKQAPFTRGDAPDFSLSGPLGGLSIECGSAHLESPTDADLSYKITGVLRDKRRKAYAAPTCALFMDATDILYTYGQRKARDPVR